MAVYSSKDCPKTGPDDWPDDWHRQQLQRLLRQRLPSACVAGVPRSLIMGQENNVTFIVSSNGSMPMGGMNVTCRRCGESRSDPQ